MKKYIFILLLLVASRHTATAQCTPDTNIGGLLIYPEDIANAMAGYYYSQVVTFRVPSDTVLDYNGTPVNAVIDSMRMLYIGGIPPGYSYSCNISSCTWPGGTLGCALIEGKTESTDTAVIGEYPIKMYIQTWARVGAFPLNRIDSSSSYTFKIKSYSGLFDIVKSEPLKVYPNPSNGKFSIELRDIRDTEMQLRVMDLTGKIVFEKAIEHLDNKTIYAEVSLPVSMQGLFLVNVTTADRVLQQRILIQP